MEAVMRYNVADYLSTGEGTFALMGVGFNTLDENPTAQKDAKTYINQKAQTTQIKSYQPTFPFDTDLISDEEAVMAIYDIGRNQKTGEDAELEYVKRRPFTTSNSSASFPIKTPTLRTAYTPSKMPNTSSPTRSTEIF